MNIKWEYEISSKEKCTPGTMYEIQMIGEKANEGWRLLGPPVVLNKGELNENWIYYWSRKIVE